ncbi:MAG: hypothetical protein AB4042_17835 [Leptolyngbyaceae cyanobacterium]
MVEQFVAFSMSLRSPQTTTVQVLACEAAFNSDRPESGDYHRI